MSNKDSLEEKDNKFISEMLKWEREKERTDDERIKKMKELKEKYGLPRIPTFTTL